LAVGIDPVRVRHAARGGGACELLRLVVALVTDRDVPTAVPEVVSAVGPLGFRPADVKAAVVRVLAAGPFGDVPFAVEPEHVVEVLVRVGVVAAVVFGRPVLPDLAIAQCADAAAVRVDELE